MLESTVVLAPRLRGTHQYALWPFLAQAYKGDNEVFVPILVNEEQPLTLNLLGDHHSPGSS